MMSGLGGRNVATPPTAGREVHGLRLSLMEWRGNNDADQTVREWGDNAAIKLMSKISPQTNRATQAKFYS